MTRRALWARLVVRRDDILDAVVERVVGSMAARIDLPVDRISDAQMVGAVLGARAGAMAADGHLRLTISDEGGLTLRIGPLEPGAGERIVADSPIPGGRTGLERVVDEWRAEASPAEGGEMLLLRFHGPTEA